MVRSLFQTAGIFVGEIAGAGQARKNEGPDISGGHTKVLPRTRAELNPASNAHRFRHRIRSVLPIAIDLEVLGDHGACPGSVGMNKTENLPGNPGKKGATSSPLTRHPPSAGGGREDWSAK
jgi:hypothetical protein